jgi:hypothetical protein
MKYIYYIAFISIVIVIGWVLRPVEHMATGTCKRRIWGPVGMDGKEYPEVYGPNGIGNRSLGPGGPASGPGGPAAGPGGPAAGPGGGVISTTSSSGGGGITQRAAMYEDDGEFNSNTATRNAAYMNVFTFKPYAKTNFPVSGPPEPYLSDFANFHR